MDAIQGFVVFQIVPYSIGAPGVSMVCPTLKTKGLRQRRSIVSASKALRRVLIYVDARVGIKGMKETRVRTNPTQCSVANRLQEEFMVNSFVCFLIQGRGGDILEATAICRAIYAGTGYLNESRGRRQLGKNISEVRRYGLFQEAIEPRWVHAAWFDCPERASEENTRRGMMTSGAKALTAFVAGGNFDNFVFRDLVEALPVAIYTTDAEGRLTYFNAAAVKLSGREPELGTDKWCVTWKIFLPDGTRLPHDQCPMAVALKGAEVPTGIECIAERPDGTRFWFTPCPAVIRDATGRIIGGINLLMDITDRKNAEIEANEHFRMIVETTPECVKIVAPDGTLLFMNSPGLSMVGASSAEAVTGKNVYDLIAADDRDRFRDFNERICQGEKGSLQFDIVGLEGARCHMETHAAPLRHVDGTTVHLAITHDITKRRQAEGTALLLGAIVDSSDDAIISKDLQGIITSWKRSAERIFGYTAAEAVGQQVATLLIPPDRLDEEPKLLARLGRGERIDHFETVRRRKDGTLLDISLTISPVRDAQGVIIGASKIARDISEHKRIQAALLASETRFRQLADTMPQIVWAAGPDGHVDYYNERWYEYTGLSRDVFGDSSWEPILHPEDVQRTRESYYASINSGQPYSIEYRLTDRSENRWRWFVGRAVPIRDAEDRIVKWFGTCTDIDEQKRVQDDLRRANEDLEQFAFSLCANMTETSCVTAISEQGGKENQHGNDERFCPPCVNVTGDI